MITINKLEELEKFKVESRKVDVNDIKMLYRYEFKENGKLADLTLNVEIPFGVSDIGKLIKLNEDEILDSEFEPVDCYEFKARNIFANKKLRLGSLEADSLICKDDCQIIFRLKVKDKIKGTNLESEFLPIICKEIDCEKIVAECIMCENVKAKCLIIKQNYFENIYAENVNMYNDMP